MRATGFPSFAYSVMTSVQSDAGVSVASQHTGRVYGTDTADSREESWTETGTDPELASCSATSGP